MPEAKRSVRKSQVKAHWKSLYPLAFGTATPTRCTSFFDALCILHAFPAERMARDARNSGSLHLPTLGDLGTFFLRVIERCAIDAPVVWLVFDRDDRVPVVKGIVEQTRHVAASSGEPPVLSKTVESFEDDATCPMLHGLERSTRHELFLYLEGYLVRHLGNFSPTTVIGFFMDDTPRIYLPNDEEPTPVPALNNTCGEADLSIPTLINVHRALWPGLDCAWFTVDTDAMYVACMPERRVEAPSFDDLPAFFVEPLEDAQKGGRFFIDFGFLRNPEVLSVPTFRELLDCAASPLTSADAAAAMIIAIGVDFNNGIRGVSPEYAWGAFLTYREDFGPLVNSNADGTCILEASAVRKFIKSIIWHKWHRPRGSPPRPLDMEPSAPARIEVADNRRSIRDAALDELVVRTKSIKSSLSSLMNDAVLRSDYIIRLFSGADPSTLDPARFGYVGTESRQTVALE